MKEQLTPTELWHISARSPTYQGVSGVYSCCPLACYHPDKNLSILDYRLWKRFPDQLSYQIWAYKILKQVSCFDTTSVAELKENFNKLGINIPIHTTSARNRSRFPKKFMLSVNSDNSFVYMDGWMGGGVVSQDKEKALRENLQVVLSELL